jgi:hypothetical protein
MNFVVKIKEISFQVLRDLQCPQPQEGNMLLNAMFNIKAPPAPLK